MPDSPQASIEGKTLLLRCEAGDAGTVLEQVRLQFIGERRFVVGVVPPGLSEGDWSAGASVGIAWDAVREFTVVDAALAERLRQAGGQRRRGWFG